MISILIPAYRYNAFPLVQKLHAACERMQIPFEIICRDDGSDDPLKSENDKINELPHAHFSVNGRNLGRGPNINGIAEKAKYDWLVILDCDVWPVSNNFVGNYVRAIRPETEAIYGGIAYKPQRPDGGAMLRWKYGRVRESIPVEKRAKNPYGSTLTSNFAIRKDVFLSIRFREDITAYGYEDLVFLHGLRDLKVEIAQIDNPAYHLNLETSHDFLNKTRISLQNLRRLYDDGLVGTSESRILQAYATLKKWRLHRLVQSVFLFAAAAAERQLLSKNPRLMLFDCYKLGYFAALKST